MRGWATRYAPSLVRLQLGVTLVVGERIAAGGDEGEHLIESLPGQPLIGRSTDHLSVKPVGVERFRASHAENVLGQHVERAWLRRRRVLRALRRRLERGLALHDLEAVGRHEQRLARLIEPVIGAADALAKPACAFRRADIDDEIDVAPVDAEIERRGADHGAELARHHGRLDFAPLADIEGAVMQRDGEIVVVVTPQLVEQHLGLRARVDEHQSHVVRLDRRVHLGQRVARRMSRPGKVGVRLEDGDVCLDAAFRGDDLGQPRRGLSFVRHEEGGKLKGARHGGGEAYRRELRR